MKEKEDKNTEFLNYVYQNARMGTTGIDDIEEKVNDVKFKTIIKGQKEKYQNICNLCIEIFIKYGKEEKDLSAMAKISTYMISLVKTTIDSSTKNLAKMMIESSNKGILEITEKLNEYNESDEEIKTVAKKLLGIENDNIEELKPFL